MLHRLQYLTFISFLKHLQLFFIRYKLSQLHMRFRSSSDYLSTYNDICLETVDGNAGLEGNTCFLQARPPLLQMYRVFHTVTKKKIILKKVTLVKNKLFCWVSPLKSSSLHRAHIAAPNPLTKNTTSYPQTSGDMVDLGTMESSVHTTAALINVTPDFVL